MREQQYRNQYYRCTNCGNKQSDGENRNIYTQSDVAIIAEVCDECGKPLKVTELR